MIQKISDSTTASFFPESFSNEIYYSKIEKEMHPFSYTSSLSIKFNKSGFDYYRIGNKEHKLKAHQAIIINSGTQVCSYTNTTSEGMSIFIDDNYLAEIIHTLKNPESILERKSRSEINFSEIPFHCDSNLGRFIERIFKNVSIDQLFGLEMNPGFYDTLAGLMLQQQLEINHKLKRIPRVRRVVREEIYRRLFIGKEFMDENICNKISLNQISKTAGISSYYFIKCFYKLYGITPYQYILTKRIELAKIDLKKGNKTVHQIAIDRGFADIFSFSRYFKRVCGQSPTEYSAS